MTHSFYSNGKLLLTGEYLVLDGALSLAIPTTYGQSLAVTKTDAPNIIWESLDHNDKLWFRCEFDSRLNIKNQSNHEIAKQLQNILQAAKKQKPSLFLEGGWNCNTKMSFPSDWGLGSSSTLLNNIAQWLGVDAYQLLEDTFGGSGYDIACAQHNTPISYQIKNKEPLIKEIPFDPSFKQQLYFIYLNKKQNSRDGISQYKKNRADHSEALNQISQISTQFTRCSSLESFEKLIMQHEQIISKILAMVTVKEKLFADYFGAIKSLGAWGGDFVLATGNEHTAAYFKKKGYATVIPFQEMCL
jgi:mevalonate kinase